MLESEARQAAEMLRKEAKVPQGAPLTKAVKRYIEIAKQAPDGKWLARDFLAWVVHFSEDAAFWEVVLDDATGKLLRTDRSR
ncbi:MAG: hypothetical protein ABIW76_03725 [Fibrobacteria bacterium]